MLRKITFALFVFAALAAGITGVAGIAHAQATFDCNPGDPGCGDDNPDGRS
jgi:hypothetical protein